MTNGKPIYDIPMVLTPRLATKKAFEKNYIPELLNLGFTQKKGVYVRKKGSIFQVIARDGCCIRYFVQPFWIEKVNEMTSFNYIDYNQKGSARLSRCDNINFPLELNPMFAPEGSFVFFKEKFLSKVDAVNDEISFAKYLAENDKYGHEIYINDYIVLFASYLTGSLDFARQYYEDSFCHYYNVKYELYLDMIERAYSEIENGNYTIDHYEPGKNIVDSKWLDYYNQGLDVESVAKIEAKKRVETAKGYGHLSIVKVALEKDHYDFQEVLEYRKVKAEKMRIIIKAEYGLEFF